MIAFSIIKGMIDVTIKMIGAMEPRARSDEHAA
jgi:hypothetical protein